MLATESNFLAELERVVRGKRPTVDPRALLFVAAEVILQGSGSESKIAWHTDLPPYSARLRIRNSTSVPSPV
jgi:hypothetical protein